MSSRARIQALEQGGRRRIRRVAMLSVHTSPLDQPGSGDAGGLNVYVLEVARRLAAGDTDVDIFTRGDGRAGAIAIAPGVTLRQLDAGKEADVSKLDLPAQLCSLSTALLRTEADWGPDHFDLIHSHYWLSGQVGAVAADHWGVPLVHSMHTMALVKNAQLPEGDEPEPRLRVLGERQIVGAADMLVANTDDEAHDLVALYSARPDRIAVVHPGVDLDVFAPGDQGVARRSLRLPDDRPVLLFVGRIQPLKAPDVFIRAVAGLDRRWRGSDRRPLAIVCGGPSGAGPERLEELRRLVGELEIGDVTRFEPPTTRHRLADWYRAADVVCVPSYSESFGLVAMEAQACGRPVLAAAVGGLRTSVADGASGVLLPDHDPDRWAAALDHLLGNDSERREMGFRAREHAEGFGWSSTVASTVDAYQRALRIHREDQDRRDRTG